MYLELILFTIGVAVIILFDNGLFHLRLSLDALQSVELESLHHWPSQVGVIGHIISKISHIRVYRQILTPPKVAHNCQDIFGPNSREINGARQWRNFEIVNTAASAESFTFTVLRLQLKSSININALQWPFDSRGWKRSSSSCRRWNSFQIASIVPFVQNYLTLI